MIVPEPVPPPLYARSAKTLWRNSPGAVVLLHVDHGEVVHLTGTGVALWELLAVPIAVTRAADLLASQFGTTADKVVSDIEPVLRQLVDQQLVEELVGV